MNDFPLIIFKLRDFRYFILHDLSTAVIENDAFGEPNCHYDL